jgi:hypothetical protein
VDPQAGSRRHRRLTSGQGTWSARCGESRTPGAGRRSRETPGGDTGTAPWADLTIHLAPELAEFAEENKAWLQICRLPAYAPDMNPAEGIWSLLKRSMVNFAAADVNGLVRIIKRKLKKIQYRPHLIDGCLAATGLKIEPW